MKKTILLAAPLGFVLFYGTSQVTAQDPECKSMSIPVCQDGTRITISNSGKTVAPPNLCVDPGETITINVVPDGTSASIAGKDGGWPTGSGSSFTLTAPASGSYDYNVYFSDGSCLDPRIRVKD